MSRVRTLNDPDHLPALDRSFVIDRPACGLGDDQRRRQGRIDPLRARQPDCQGCSFRQQCTPNMPARKVTRSIHEGARDLARDIAATDAYLVSRRQRKKVEMLFAHLKRILKLDRLRLRGPNGARDEFHLAATAQNLRKLAKIIPMSAQPLPA
jgi:Transposase DDE domain